MAALMRRHLLREVGQTPQGAAPAACSRTVSAGRYLLPRLKAGCKLVVDVGRSSLRGAGCPAG
eukprot:1498882-Heterocapsa_arctica.AAC.1